MKPALSFVTPPTSLVLASSSGGEEVLHLAAAAEHESSVSISNRQIALFLFTYVAYAAIYFARKPVSVVKSTLESELGLSRTALGGVDTALLGAYMAGQFMTGSLVKVLGRTLPLTLGYAICGAATLSMGFLSTAHMMSIAWAICGFFQACMNPLLVIFVADLFPASMRASAVGLWQTSQQVGGVAANAFAGCLLKSRGWRSVFISSGVFVAAFAPILALVMARAAPTTPPPAASKKTPAAAPTKQSPLGVPGVSSVAAAYTLVKMSRYCLMFWAPYFLSNHVGMDASAAALMATIFDVAGVIGSITAGLICDRFLGGRMISTQLPFIGATALSFASWGALCLAEKKAGTTFKRAHVAAMALVGFCVAAPDGVLGGAASRNLCDYAGSSDVALAAAASGLVNGCGSVGAILQGGLTGKLVDNVGWSGLFLTLASAMAATAAALVPAVGVELRAFASRV